MILWPLGPGIRIFEILCLVKERSPLLKGETINDVKEEMERWMQKLNPSENLVKLFVSAIKVGLIRRVMIFENVPGTLVVLLLEIPES